MSMRKTLPYFPFLALLAAGCGDANVPAVETSTDPVVETSTVREALNGTGDFRFGVTVVNANSTGTPICTSTTKFTPVLSGAPLNTTVVSDWASCPNTPDPNGLRVTVEPTTSGSASGYMIYLDFRLMLQAKDDAGGTTIGPEMWTSWASDIGAFATEVTNATDRVITSAHASNPDAHPSFFRVGFQIRSWPKANRTLLNFNLGCAAYATDPYYGEPWAMFWTTKYNHWYSNGGGSTPMCSAALANPPYNQRGFGLFLNVKYQDVP